MLEGPRDELEPPSADAGTERAAPPSPARFDEMRLALAKIEGRLRRLSRAADRASCGPQDWRGIARQIDEAAAELRSVAVPSGGRGAGPSGGAVPAMRETRRRTLNIRCSSCGGWIE